MQTESTFGAWATKIGSSGSNDHGLWVAYEMHPRIEEEVSKSLVQQIG